MITNNCPVCGHPMSAMDALLAEHDASYQCRHCWNRVRASAPAKKATAADFRPVGDRAKTSHRAVRVKEKKP
ncbi:MAG TPA: hypothetical protein VNL38_00635 [Candidatus Nitrosotenuis sp.]|nr:hypothetical protein [Candidatus Nitrosotenuis sp.]